MNRRQLYYLSIAVLLAMSGVLWFFLIPEAKEQSANQASRVQDEELKLSKNQKKIGQYREVLDRYRNNLKGIDAFRSFLSRDPFESQHAISDSLEALSRKYHLTLTRVNYQKGNSSKSGLLSMEISLPLSGNYRDFRSFLIELDQKEPFLAIGEIKVEGMDESGILKMELSLASYFTQEMAHE